MRCRHEVSDAEWERLQPLLPPRRSGKRRKHDRLVVNGIVWQLRQGRSGRHASSRYPVNQA